MSLRGRDLLSVADLTADEVGRVFATAEALKAEFRATRRHAAPPLVGRTLAMLFQKPSLRTRVTFEAGMAQLGGTAIYLPEDAVMGAREAVRDVAHNLERFVDAIVARTGPHAVVVELAAQASIPVINGLTLREHPCQALADVFTIREHVGALRGHGRDLRRRRQQRLPLAGPARAWPSGWRSAWPIRRATAPTRRSWPRPSELAAASGGRLVFGADPVELVQGAAVVYTDAWTSMGQEVEAEERRDAFAGYRVDDALLAAAGPDAIVMHCLPAHRGEEIASSVMDGPQSRIFEQSENRLHVQKALLVELLGDGAAGAA